MEDTETNTTPNEFEVIQVFGVYTRVGIDLESVIVMCGVLEKTVEWVEHLMREEEEEFSKYMISMKKRISKPRSLT